MSVGGGPPPPAATPAATDPTLDTAGGGGGGGGSNNSGLAYPTPGHAAGNYGASERSFYDYLDMKGDQATFLL
ncbi:hypothetical protein ACLKA7_016874 [Drosophila subpalustris]